MPTEIPTLPVETLAAFMRDVFTGCGVPADEAAICAEVLITSDRRGIESHGIGRLKLYFDRIRKGIQLPTTNFEIVRETPATAVVDGHHGMGQVIGVRSMELAIAKARQCGMGSVAVRNSTHFGIAGYYPLMAVKAGMIGMAFTNARPSIAPTFSVQPMLGTNPIAFGAPTDEDCPFLYDAATSITQRGKFEVLARKGKPAKPGWAINANGETITDAEQVLQGFAKDAADLLPLGGAGEDLAGYKGYGLATIVEILSASLQQGNSCGIYPGSALKAKPNPITWVISLWLFRLKLFAHWKTSNIQPEKLSANYELPAKHRESNAFSQPVKKNLYPKKRQQKGVCQSWQLCKKIF